MRHLRQTKWLAVLIIGGILFSCNDNGQVIIDTAINISIKRC